MFLAASVLIRLANSKRKHRLQKILRKSSLLATEIRRSYTEKVTNSSSEHLREPTAPAQLFERKDSNMAQGKKLTPMAPKTSTDPNPDHHPDPDRVISLTRSLSRGLTFQRFSFWMVGSTPLICHAWSEKAKREMLQKQVKATKGGKDVRDPQADFVSSLYEMGDEGYGFPSTGVKNALLSAAHKDRNLPRNQVMGALWLDAELVRVRPALAGAICDMPLIRIYGSQPEMREDMVKIGAGLNKVANLSYRAQFSVWAMKVTGNYNRNTLTDEALAFLIEESGLSCGLGEWRNERKGLFGAFRLATSAEETAWEDFKNGKGPLPLPAHMKEAAE